MISSEVALEALSALCNASVTSVQQTASLCYNGYFCTGYGGGVARLQLSIKNFIPTIFDADEIRQASRSNFNCLRGARRGVELASCLVGVNHMDTTAVTEKNHIIDMNEFFDPRFDYDFTNLRDTETYYRGGEVYERPCGWQRFGLKVLDKYEGNTWLGTRYRSTESVPGEWPVSYHGTSKEGAEGIIKGFYKPGPRERHGRGVYSTPYISVVLENNYAKTFTSKKTGKTYLVVLQNRVNPEYRAKHNNDKYWLVDIPKGTSAKEEQEMVERAIRPYGLLLKEV